MGLDEKLVEKAADAAAARAKRDTPGRAAGVEQRVLNELREALHRHPKELTGAHSLTLGERWAGRVARTSGNWKTILPYLGVTALYLVINHWVYAFDQTLQYYTFAVSVLAIFLAQVILLFQNRQSDLESVLAHNAYEQTAEIFTMQQQQVETLEAIRTLVQRHEEILAKLDHMMIDVHSIVHRVDASTASPDGDGLSSTLPD